MKKQFDSVVELRQLSFQLHALAYLLSLTGGTGDKQLEHVHWGLGEILERLGKRAMYVAREIERVELSRAKES